MATPMSAILIPYVSVSGMSDAPPLERVRQKRYGYPSRWAWGGLMGQVVLLPTRDPSVYRTSVTPVPPSPQYPAGFLARYCWWSALAG
ncbi:hypothetical protein GCM10010344_23010 [Streptomyces bluensis]|nr:hypothetical protein GCM10010344_23010 [Streptomyces bluensis]